MEQPPDSMETASQASHTPDSVPTALDPALVQSLRSTGQGRMVFSRFRLVRELGRGGMGVVWLAQDERLNLEVALKFLPGMVASDSDALDDLRQETTRGLRLAHHGVVRVYDLHQDPQEGTAAIAMEYVDGTTLAEEKSKQPDRCFDPQQLLPCLEQLCQVLTYVHEKARMVHRDLKPRNLMMTKGGQLKVTDFGVAAAIVESHSRLTGARNSGTPAYMSPQQALGERATPADDIYAVGATLYELLTSRPPFFRGSLLAIMRQVQTEQPPSIATRRAELGIKNRPRVPRHWERTIAACLSKPSRHRPASAEELWDRLSAKSITHRSLYRWGKLGVLRLWRWSRQVGRPRPVRPAPAAEGATTGALATASSLELAATQRLPGPASSRRPSRRLVWALSALGFVLFGCYLLFRQSPPAASAPLKPVPAIVSVPSPKPALPAEPRGNPGTAPSSRTRSYATATPASATPQPAGESRPSASQPAVAADSAPANDPRATPAPLLPTAAPVPVTPKATPFPGTYTTYKVKRRDTLIIIARRYKVSYEALIKLNNITDPDKVFEGEVLFIPRKDGR